MNVFGQNKRWGGHLLAGWVVATVVGTAAQGWSAQPLILTNSSPQARSASGYVYSSGLSDILKMVDAKVDPEVIKAYIKNSSVPYNPSAAEVIALKDHGVPPDVLTAVLQRGAELRAQAAQAPQYAQGQGQYPGAAAPNMAMPPYPSDYGTDYGLYPADYGYGYPYSPYGAAPYSYWWYNSFWPWYSWGPGFGFGFDNFGHHHHGQFHRFNNFSHVRFQNFDFNRFGGSVPFQSFSSSPFNNARFQNFDFNHQFNRGFMVPRVGISHLGVPSRAFGPAAFANGTAPAAFIGAPGGSAGMIRAPGVTGVRTGGFAVRAGGMGHVGGGMGHGGGGGGGHR